MRMMRFLLCLPSSRVMTARLASLLSLCRCRACLASHESLYCFLSAPWSSCFLVCLCLASRECVRRQLLSGFTFPSPWMHARERSTLFLQEMERKEQRNQVLFAGRRVHPAHLALRESESTKSEARSFPLPLTTRLVRLSDRQMAHAASLP